MFLKQFAFRSYVKKQIYQNIPHFIDEKYSYFFFKVLVFLSSDTLKFNKYVNLRTESLHLYNKTH